MDCKSAIGYALHLWPALLLLMPAVVHLLEVFIHRAEIVDVTYLRRHLEDANALAAGAATDYLFEQIEDFDRFKEQAKFVLSLLLFCIISIIVSWLELRTYLMALAGALTIVAILIVALLFVLQLSKRKFKAGNADSVRMWRRVAYAAVGVTFLVEASNEAFFRCL